MSLKIVGALEDRVKQLVESGYIAAYIGKETDLNWGSIIGWCKRNNKVLGNFKNPEFREKELEFIELIRNGMILKHACQKVDIDHSTGVAWASRNNLDSAIRTRAEAAQDKLISFEEAKSRLPSGNGEIMRYDAENKFYVIKREDGTEYTRILSQLFRGDPQKSQKPRITEQEAANILGKIGYRLIPGTFRIKREPLEAEHMECGYIRKNILANFSKQGCPKCTNTGTSKEEIQMDEWVKSLGVHTEKYHFKKDCIGKGKGKEIDIFIRELNIGIEYCGLYSHGEENRVHQVAVKQREYAKRGKTYKETLYDSARLCHKIKLNKANEFGFSLITVFSNEWKESQEKVKAIIKAKLGKNDIKIGARETDLKEIDKGIAKSFLDSYHLQGAASMLIAFGLFHKKELVAVITGNHHHRTKGKFVLNRLCFKASVTISGGASKLNKALEEWATKNGISEIISWSDNRWSGGGVYKALGYELSGEVAPDYFYFDNKGKTYSKQSCQKEALLARGATGNTEWEMAQSLKLDRIYDCGKKTWVKKLT